MQQTKLDLFPASSCMLYHFSHLSQWSGFRCCTVLKCFVVSFHWLTILSIAQPYCSKLSSEMLSILCSKLFHSFSADILNSDVRKCSAATGAVANNWNIFEFQSCGFSFRVSVGGPCWSSCLLCKVLRWVGSSIDSTCWPQERISPTPQNTLAPLVGEFWSRWSSTILFTAT